MKRFSSVMCLAALLAVCAFGLPSADAQSPAPKLMLENVAPADTDFFFSLSDVTGTGTRFKTSDIGKLWNDPELQAGIGPMLEWVKAQMAKAEGDLKNETGLSFDDILSSFRGQCAVAVIVAPVPTDAPGVLFAIDAGEGRINLFKLMKSIAESRAKSDKKFNVENFKSNGLDAVAWKQLKDSELCYAFAGNVLIGSTSRDVFEAATGRFVKGGQALVGSALFSKARAKSGQSSDMFMFVNAESLWDKFGVMIPPDAVQPITAFGLMDFKYLAVSAGFLPDGNTRVFVDINAPGQRQGLSKIMAVPSKPLEGMLKLCPKNSVFASAGVFDMGASWNELMSSIDKCGEVAMLPKMLFDGFEAQLGVSIGNDLLSNIGNEAASFSVFPSEAGSFVMDSIIYVKLKDQKKFSESFEKVVSSPLMSSSLEFKKITYKGRDIKYILSRVDPDANFMENMMRGPNMGKDPMASVGMFLSYMSINYFINPDGYLVWGSTVHALKREIDRVDGKPTQCVMDSENFKKTVTPDQLNGSSFMYSELGKMVPMYYNTLVPVLYILEPFARLNNVPFDPALMPSGEAVAKYFRPGVTTIKSDAEGVYIESKGVDIVTVAGGVAGVAIVAAIAIPSMLSSKVKANETAAMVSLKSLCATEATWAVSDMDRNSVKDFWVADVSGFYRVQDAAGNPVAYIDIGFAKADYAPVMEGAGTPTVDVSLTWSPVAKSGYYYMAIQMDSSGNAIPMDADGAGQAYENLSSFAFCAFPSDYGSTGKKTFIVSEAGTVYQKDTYGQAVYQWPADLESEGWEMVD